MAAKPIGFKGLNTRYRRLADAFGYDSDIVKAAGKFIEYRFNKSYLTYGKDENGKTVLTGISQSKKTAEALGDHKWTSYDEWVPTVNDVYDRAKEIVNSIDNQNVYGPTLNVDFTKSTKTLRQDPVAKQYLLSKAEHTAHLLNTNDDIIDNVYEAAKDESFSRQAEAKRMEAEIKDKAWLAYDLQWLNDANELVNAWWIERSMRAVEEDW